MSNKLPSGITDLLDTTALRDEGLLLRELQHRHANDITIVVAALMVCARKLTRGSARAQLLHETARRVQAIGDVNMILAEQGGGGVEDLAPALEMLCEAAERRGPAHVRIVATTQSVVVRNFVCRRLAMVVNELILNAVKHGCAGGRPMLVRVTLSDDGSGTYVCVENDGAATGWTRGGSQGVGLVNEIVSRLGGEVVRSSTGSKVRVTMMFPTLAVPFTEEPF